MQATAVEAAERRATNRTKEPVLRDEGEGDTLAGTGTGGVVAVELVL